MALGGYIYHNIMPMLCMAYNLNAIIYMLLICLLLVTTDSPVAMVKIRRVPLRGCMIASRVPDCRSKVTDVV